MTGSFKNNALFLVTTPFVPRLLSIGFNTYRQIYGIAIACANLL